MLKMKMIPNLTKKIISAKLDTKAYKFKSKIFYPILTGILLLYSYLAYDKEQTNEIEPVSKELSWENCITFEILPDKKYAMLWYNLGNYTKTVIICF